MIGRQVYSTHPAAAAVGSGMARRRRNLRINKEHQYCPAGLTACSVGEDADGYEVSFSHGSHFGYGQLLISSVSRYFF